MALREACPMVEDTVLDRRFREVFEREFDYVWASLRRLGVHGRDLDDLAQDVFILVHDRWAAYDASRPIRPWLFAFALRCASDWRRLARHRSQPVDDLDLRAGSAQAADEALALAEDRNLILRALEHVDLERRAVLILYEFDECPMKQIADSLGIPLFTAYSRLRVARQELTQAVRRLQAQEERR
jgi:RNA polymerase sigma-70 factor (ECF subfamily)